MSFVRSEYLVFLLTVLCTYWALPRRGQNVLLLVASAVFYGWVHPWFVLLLGASATLDFVCARAMADHPERRLALLRLSLCGNALTLGFFKYFDFFVANAQMALASLGLSVNDHTLGILLPVGISFYTFQTVAYTIDVYRGKVEARRSYLDYLVFVSFFPQLVAGPIERAGYLLPQLERPRAFSWTHLRDGAALAVWGAFKKVVIADSIAPYVDAAYATDDPSWTLAWAGCLGFMVQILADFSGYTDIARGTARMLGVELSVNFDHPYLATSPTNLWDRWHISLSHWLRDYVFYPASTWRWGRRWLRIPGLPESGATVLARATVITMLFSGLWHGAQWHFVLWGAWWAVVQIAWMLGERRVPRSWSGSRHWRWAQLALMVPVHVVSHQLFREPTVHRLANTFFGDPFAGTPEQHLVAAVTLAMAALGAALLTGAMFVELRVLPELRASPLWLPAQATTCAVLACAVFAFAQASQASFVYFAF